MHKKIILYLSFLVMSGCSVFNYQKDSITDDIADRNVESLLQKNITNNSFFIQKAEVELITENRKEGFLVSLKYSKPDTFLISIKSKTGIEAGRIFVTNDTILINDRVNKILYYGSGIDMKRKFGFSSNLLPALVGDLVLTDDSFKTDEDCKNGIYNIISNFNEFKLEYMLDCNSGRLKKIQISEGIKSKSIFLHYSDTRKKNQFFYYSKIFIPEFREYKYVSINIKNIEIPFKDRLEFIPGKNYEVVRIK